MKKKIVNVFLMALLATATVGTVVSCKDYEEDNYADLNGKITNLDQAVDAQVAALEERVKTLETVKDQLQKDVDALRNELGTAEDGADKTTIYGRLASAEALIEAINGQIATINETLASKADKSDLDALTERVVALEGCCEAYKDLASRVTTNEEAIKKLQELINEETIKLWSDAIEKATKDAAEALEQAKLDKARLDKLEELLGENFSELDDFAEFKDAVASALQNADGTWNSLEDVLAEQLESVKGSYDGTLEDVVAAYEQADMDLAADIDALTKRVEDLELATEELNDKLGLVNSILNQYVSGVIVQGTNNPVYGTFALPVGISSNVLAAYYGTPDGDIYFPAVYDEAKTNGMYVFSKDGTSTKLTAEDLKALGVNVTEWATADHSYLVADQDGNAGTLYLTVNPVGQDHTDAIPTLENSAGVKSGVELSPLKPSDKVLSFGYTRGVENGFYETKATVKEGAIEAIKPRVTYDDIKSLYTDAKSIVDKIINNKSTNGIGVDLKSLATTLYSVSSNILDANAVKFSWTAEDEEGNAIDETRSVMSKYELAATAVKPLSYNTWINANYDRLPGIGHVENIIGKIFDKVEGAIPTFDIDDVKIEIGKIEISNPTIDKVTTTVTIDMSDVKNPDGTPVDNKVITVDITDAVQKALNDAMGGIQGDLNEFVADLNEQIGQINDLLAELQKVNNIGQQISDIENAIYDYLYKGQDLALKFINNANKLLQPVMLVKTSDSFLIPSTSVSAPTKFNAAGAAAGISLYPTSYTAEILAPAYMKLVGVTNVYKNGKSAQGGDADCEAALKAVNSASEGFASAKYGFELKDAKLMGAKAGYTYEVVYTAVDYSGKVVVKKYYIELV